MKTLSFLALLLASLNAHAAPEPSLSPWALEALEEITATELSANQATNLALAERDALNLLQTASLSGQAPSRTLLYCVGAAAGTGRGARGVAYCRGGGASYTLKTGGTLGVGINLDAFVMVASPEVNDDIAGTYYGGQFGAAILVVGGKAGLFQKTEKTSRIYLIGYQAGIAAQIQATQLALKQTN